MAGIAYVVAKEVFYHKNGNILTLFLWQTILFMLIQLYQ